MTRDEARQEIRKNWRTFFPPDGSKKGIVCPLCHNGSGRDGDGIRENPKAKERGGLICFKCGFRGDIIDLIQQETGADFNSVLNTCAATLGISIDEYSQEAVRSASAATKKATNATQDAPQAPQSHGTGADDKTAAADDRTPQGETEAHEVADYTAYYKECRKRLQDPAAVTYLQQRGISMSTAISRGLGYDPAWISPTAVRKQREKGSDWTPPATARIILPVTRNHYIARAVDNRAVHESFRKMNETGGGEAGLFGWRELEKGHEVIFIVEGAFDALSVLESECPAIALNSTNNAEKLIKMLQEAPPTGTTFVLCLDNDEAGKKATEILRAGMDRLNICNYVADICTGHKDPNEALVLSRAYFLNTVLKVKTRASAKPDIMTSYIDDIMSADIARMKAAGEKKTGFPLLDEKSGGLYPGLYVIAALSSLGKTTFAGCIADNLASSGHDVIFFSLEQSRLEIVTKSFSRILATEYDDPAASLALRKGYYPDKLRKAAEYYRSHIAGHLSIIEGNFACNVTYISDYVRRYINRNGCTPVVFVDYLQILQPAEEMRRATTKEAVDYTVTELKRLSRELDLTIFVISSVNRANYLIPIDFESLKESGGIEYTADVIWGLQLYCINEKDVFMKEGHIKEKRIEIKNAKSANPREIQLVCLKNRYGTAVFDNVFFHYYPDKDVFQQVTGGFMKYLGKDMPFQDEENDQKQNAGNARR